MRCHHYPGMTYPLGTIATFEPERSHRARHAYAAIGMSLDPGCCNLYIRLMLGTGSDVLHVCLDQL